MTAVGNKVVSSTSLSGYGGLNATSKVAFIVHIFATSSAECGETSCVGDSIIARRTPMSKL